MHINIHCAIAIILTMIFWDFLNIFQVILILSISILIDFDFLFSKFAKDHNHRRLPTHSFIPYLILMPFGLLLIEFFWIGIAGIFHIFIDMIDWGIYPLTPRIKDKILGGFLFVPKIDKNSEPPKKCYFIRTYYQSKLIISLECITFIISLILVIWRSIFFLFLFIPYILFLIMHLMTFLKMCK